MSISGKLDPVVRRVTFADIADALTQGLRDFQAAPLYGLAFGLAYAAFGWFLVYLMIGLDFGSYVYPMVTGFALVAPFAAAGLYEVSRRLERNAPLTWGAILGCVFGRIQSNSSITLMPDRPKRCEVAPRGDRRKSRQSTVGRGSQVPTRRCREDQ